MKCFYHNDLDGRAAAFCVYAWVGIKNDLEKEGVLQQTEFIEINYGKPFPFESIKPKEQIWIVDYSIEPSEMLKLLSITKDVTWIDHHKTAIDKYKDFPCHIKGIRRDGEAGCVLAWKYIHWWSGRGAYEQEVGNDAVPVAKTYPIPHCILLTGDRDVWKWEFGDATRQFFNGSQLYDTQPSSSFWLDCMNHEIEDVPGTGNAEAREKGKQFWRKLMEQGHTVELYKQATDDDVNKQLGYETVFHGYKCFAINRGRISSDRFGTRIKEYDILMPYYHDGTMFTVSLYSEKVDVSEIAKQYGGGGHKGASGFQCVQLPFIKSM